MLGDFNSRHPFWGDRLTNRRGRDLMNFLSRSCSS
ncbi:hypothetical protein [Escherichia coli]